MRSSSEIDEGLLAYTPQHIQLSSHTRTHTQAHTLSRTHRHNRAEMPGALS